MLTLADAGVREALLARLARLTPNAHREFGTMTPGEMLRHLIDSFDGVTGKRVISPASSWASRTVIRYLALYLPMKWPPGVPTRPEVDPKRSGTPPGDFDEDRRTLAAMIEQLGADPNPATWTCHPGFGTMSQWQWKRWGFLHVDHHLRQFGV